MSKTILVTGPIGSGKSALCARLIDLGYPVYDCDSRTKALYASVPGLKERIEQALEISWSEIATIFSDDAKREKLESIVYPYVVKDILAWREKCDKALIFVESAIAMDKRQFDGLYDEVLLVTADKTLRASRNPKVLDRDALQSFDLNRVDYVLENNSTLEELYLKLDNLLCKLI